jgi:hypothetical protein
VTSSKATIAFTHEAFVARTSTAIRESQYADADKVFQVKSTFGWPRAMEKRPQERALDRHRFINHRADGPGTPQDETTKGINWWFDEAEHQGR